MSDNEKLNLALRQEISGITPNRVDDLLARLGPQTAAEAPVQEPPRRNVRRLRTQLIAAVLALVLLTSGVLLGLTGARRSVVIIDADASVAFTVDGFNRVRSVRLEDAYAVSIINPETLTGKRLDAAVADVTTQMIAGGALSADDNAVLLSVQEDNGGRADALIQRTNKALNQTAAAHSVAPAVLIQTLGEKEMAADGISLGRSTFVARLTGDVADARTETLAHASLQDLMYYSAEQNADLSDTTTLGTLNTAGYCTADSAVSAACGAAGAVPTAVETNAVLGWQETELVYIVSVRAANGLTYYCVSARTGEVLDVFTPELPTEADAPTDSDTSSSGWGSGTPSVPSHLPTPTASPVTPVPTTTPRVTIRDFERLIQFWDDII